MINFATKEGGKKTTMFWQKESRYFHLQECCHCDVIKTESFSMAVKKKLSYQCADFIQQLEVCYDPNYFIRVGKKCIPQIRLLPQNNRRNEPSVIDIFDPLRLSAILCDPLSILFRSLLSSSDPLRSTAIVCYPLPISDPLLLSAILFRSSPIHCDCLRSSSDPL